jgi:hypothetical protein
MLAVPLKSLERTNLASSVIELKLLTTHLIESRWEEIKPASAKYVLNLIAMRLPGGRWLKKMNLLT